MTLDEAIKYFEEMVEIGETYDVSKIVEENSQLLEWLKDYKRLLEQQSCEDAISRQAAINAFERFIHELGIKDEPYNYGEMALSAKNVPSVTPKPKMGCEGCTYEKTGNNSTYPCSHCSRCYTDKYKAESEVRNE